MVDNSNNEPDEEESGTVKEVTGNLTGTGSVNAQITLGYSAKDIRERLENEEGGLALALVLTSTRLEMVLGRAIADRYDISEEQFQKLYGDKGLGRYCHVTSVLGLFEQHQGTLQDVASYRNDLVHFESDNYGYLDQLEDEDAESEEVEETIKAAIEFIEEVER